MRASPGIRRSALRSSPAASQPTCEQGAKLCKPAFCMVVAGVLFSCASTECLRDPAARTRKLHLSDAGSKPLPSLPVTARQGDRDGALEIRTRKLPQGRNHCKSDRIHASVTTKAGVCFISTSELTGSNLVSRDVFACTLHTVCIRNDGQHGALPAYVDAPGAGVAHEGKTAVSDCRQFARRTRNKWRRHKLRASLARGPAAKQRCAVRSC